MPRIHIVYIKAPDYETVEAFLDKDAFVGHGLRTAQEYLADELKEPGATGQIKTVEFGDLPCR